MALGVNEIHDLFLTFQQSSSIKAWIDTGYGWGSMFESMRRLHSRGRTSRRVVVDENGAMLGPDCLLVQRTPHGYRLLDRAAAGKLQDLLLDGESPDWLFEQCRRIAEALDRGDTAFAQILGLHIPIGELDDLHLKCLCHLSSLMNANFNPDEPRVPAGGPDGGEWADEGAPEADPAAARPPATPGEYRTGDPNRFFDTVYDKFHALAQRLGIDETWLLGLAAHESGYLDQHNRELNDPLGVTHGGGPNVAYGSIDAAVAYWERRYGPVVRGATSAEDIVNRLFQDRYNRADRRWRQNVLGAIRSIPRHLSAWQARQGGK